MITKEQIELLKKTIPFKWRVQRGFVDSNKQEWVSMIPYIDARDVQKQLDEVIGAMNWQDEYYTCKNTLFCRIGIYVSDKWMWKSGAGSESSFEKQKGEASDAFKRAALKWGINRDAYSVGQIYIKAKSYVDGSGKKQYQPMDRNTKLKGDSLNDFCNTKAKIEELPNFNLNEEDQSLKVLA